MAGKYVDDCGGIKIPAIESAMKELKQTGKKKADKKPAKKKAKRK